MHALGPAMPAVDAGGRVILDLRAEAPPVAVPSLPEPLRVAAVATWLGRMVNETRSVRTFEGLADQMELAGLSAAWVARARTFARQEREHGRLCAGVALSLGGVPVADLGDDPVFPFHPEVDPIEGVVRNLLHVSCLSESIAVALIGHERALMPDGPLRERLTSILADECAHAAFGWRLVRVLAPRVDTASFLPWLRLSFAHVERHELRHIPLGAWPAEGATVGLCDGGVARELLVRTIEDLVVPGLDELGFPASEAWRARAAA